MTNDIDSEVPTSEPPAAPTPRSSHFELLFAPPRDQGRESLLPTNESELSAPELPTVSPIRRARPKNAGSRALDWVAFAFAFLAPPLGILLALAALVVGWNRNGWTTTVAKVAIAISVTLSILLAAGGIVFADALGKQAAHNALVASSVRFCTRIQGAPGVLESSTFGWPPVGDSIDDSIPPMQKYESFWSHLATVSPKGIRPDVERVDAAARTIIDSVTTSRVLDDSANVAQLQRVVAASGISEWVSEYCR